MNDPPRCATEGCGLPAGAVVAAPDFEPTTVGFVIVRPLTSKGAPGEPRCVDCTHHVIDLMLLRSTPKPTESQ